MANTQKVLVFQWYFLLERLPLMDAHAAIRGIQEVRGSIPLSPLFQGKVLFLVSEWERGFVLCYDFAHVHTEAELFKVNIKINVQLLIVHLRHHK